MHMPSRPQFVLGRDGRVRYPCSHLWRCCRPVYVVWIHLVSGDAMNSKWPQRIRAILRDEKDGCTVAELADRLEAKNSSIAAALAVMPDTYVDR